MIVKILFKLITTAAFFILIAITSSKSSDGVNIVVKINEDIITNKDLEKEIGYLKIFNPQITNLKDSELKKIATKSLINEIIKKKEVIKYIDIKLTEIEISGYLNNIYLQLGIKDEKEFVNKLNNYNSYELSEIIKKIKFELLWNDLIFTRYNNQIKIDKEKLLATIKEYKNQSNKEYLLSEIVFQKDNQSLQDLINKIHLSIKDIGFNNTANIFSISNSAKTGGKINWIGEQSLSKDVIKKIRNLKEGQYSEVINIGNNFVILKVEKIRVLKKLFNEDEELEKLIKNETEQQINKYSKIFFDKAKANYLIDEK
jgi:peptidyl-prolyl cis-trans isomerase SurA